MNLKIFLPKCIGGECAVRSGILCHRGKLKDLRLEKKTVFAVFEWLKEECRGKLVDGTEKQNYKMSFEIRRMLVCDNAKAIFLNTIGETVTLEVPAARSQQV